MRVPAAQGGLPGSSQPAEAPALSQRQPITCQCAIERSTSHDNSHGLSVAHGALHVLTIWPDLGSLRFHISQQNLDYKECASWNAATFTAGGWGCNVPAQSGGRCHTAGHSPLTGHCCPRSCLKSTEQLWTHS